MDNRISKEELEKRKDKDLRARDKRNLLLRGFKMVIFNDRHLTLLVN